MDDSQVLIVGGGIAGLTAALYLARYRRRAVVLTTEQSRARWIPKSHNIPGFKYGIEGPAFLSNLEQQARELRVDIRVGEVTQMRQSANLFRVEFERNWLHAPFAIMATGVQDVLPDIPGAEAALRAGILRICPICDGFESRGRRIAVLGSGAHAEREAQFLRTYSEDITLIALQPIQDEQIARCRAANIQLIGVTAKEVKIQDRQVLVALPAGDILSFDILYLALGCRPRTHLLHGIGVQLDDRGAVVVDEHQRTTLEGLYAAGDVVRGLNQIVIAAAEGAIAATAIHNLLSTGYRVQP